MKKHFCTTLLILLFPAWLLAQETVHPITVVHRENDFYVTQVRLWKAVTEREPQNALAWQNYYHAARYKDFPAIREDKAYTKEVDQLIEDMRRAIPNTFECHYITAWHRGFGDENLDELMKAYAIDSTRHKIAEDLFTHHYKKGEWQEADRFMQKWYNQKSLTPQLLHLSNNLLACTEENGILFLSGDNDSYPTWMLQSVKNIRPDVATLNAYLVMDEDHARKIFKRYDIKVDASIYTELAKDKKDLWGNVAKLIQHIAEKNPDRKIYIPTTMHQPTRGILGDNLYLVGLVFEYCNGHFDEIAVLKRNWERNMKMDYLSFGIYGEGYHYSPTGLPYTLLVYIYPAMMLYHHYQEAGDTQKATELLDFSKNISEKVGKPDHYKNFL